MEWRDPQTGQIKTWVWIAGAGGLLLLFFIISRMQSATSAQTVSPGQSSDITDQLSQMQDAINGLLNQQGGGLNPPPTTNPPPTGNPPPTTNPPPVTSIKQYLGYTSYTVQRGDTLTRIAQKYGIGYKKILEANPKITDPNLIRTGATLKIPVKTAGSTWDTVKNQFYTTITSVPTGIMTTAISVSTPYAGSSNLPNTTSAASNPTNPAS